MSPSLPARVGRYDIVERLGTGGMGVVYLATDPLLRRTVAVKVLLVENDELRERFAREGRSAAALRHNNIVTIYDVGEDHGQPFIAMEFIDGESMAEMIRRRAPLPMPRRLQLMGELCAGLGYAHRNGIVHRDIKPANLMITSEGGLKILDFGLARVIAEPTLGASTGVGTLLGTPHYLAPEQIAGTAADQVSDIFSVGLVLYEFLSYRRAFPGDSGPAILFDIVERQPTPIRELVPDIDSELEAILGKAIEKDRARRYSDLAAMAAGIERVRARLTRSADAADAPAGARRKQRATDDPSKGRSGITELGERTLDAIAQRRAVQIAEHVSQAATHLEAGRYQEAIEHCEHALLLDPQDEQALKLLRDGHRGAEDAQIDDLVNEARAQLERGALTEAEQLIQQSLRLRTDRQDLLALQNELKERRREREHQAERQRSAQSAFDRATRSMEGGALDAAVRSASEALAFDPAHSGARDLKARAVAQIEERQREPQRAEHVTRPLPLARHQEPHSAKQPPTAWRPSRTMLMAAGVLLAIVVGAWLTVSKPSTSPPVVAPAAEVTPPGPPPDRVAQENAARYQSLLQRAQERLSAKDADGAAAAILEAGKILADDPRLDDLRKEVDRLRADALREQQEQQRADIDRALGQAAKLPNDNDALASLQRALARYPDSEALREAISTRTRARDARIADRVGRAQGAPDEQAVQLLQEALGFNPSRVDVRRELDRRRASLSASTARDPRTAGRAEVEEDIRKTLYKYQDAYASRSVDDVLKIALFWTRAQLESEFSSFRTIQLNIQNVRILFDDGATRATVRCRISTVSVPAAADARPVVETRAWQFQFTFAAGAWQIASRQALK
jgi:tetratricopeptide (TPR) repeat protein/predicted Ser/Thr protein kinase